MNDFINWLHFIKQAIEYNGDRTLEAIIKFIEADGKQESSSSTTVINIIFLRKINSHPHY